MYEMFRERHNRLIGQRIRFHRTATRRGSEGSEKPCRRRNRSHCTDRCKRQPSLSGHWQIELALGGAKEIPSHQSPPVVRAQRAFDLGSISRRQDHLRVVVVHGGFSHPFSESGWNRDGVLRRQRLGGWRCGMHCVPEASGLVKVWPTGYTHQGFPLSRWGFPFQTQGPRTDTQHGHRGRCESKRAGVLVRQYHSGKMREARATAGERAVSQCQQKSREAFCDISTCAPASRVVESAYTSAGPLCLKQNGVLTLS